MKIHLDEPEIQKALLEFLISQNIPLDDKDITITLTAGRGVNGHSADFDIVDKVPAPNENNDEPAEDDQAIDFSFGKDPEAEV